MKNAPIKWFHSFGKPFQLIYLSAVYCKQAFAGVGMFKDCIDFFLPLQWFLPNDGLIPHYYRTLFKYISILSTASYIVLNVGPLYSPEDNRTLQVLNACLHECSKELMHCIVCTLPLPQLHLSYLRKHMLKCFLALCNSHQSVPYN